MPKIAIRPAKAEDIPLILKLIKDLATYEKEPEAAVATPELMRQHLFSVDPKAHCILAFLDNEPAGFAVYFYNFSTWLGKPGLYLEDLFVEPHLRQNGVGQALLKRLARVAVETDCGRMEWSALNWNRLAIDFYLNLGAEALDAWTVYRLTGDKIRQLAEE
jgi:GNAT superfamily N-acetyltransferase